MEESRKDIAGKREHTDVSLAAERDGTAIEVAASEARKRSLAVGLMEHERLTADKQLRRFSDRGDTVEALRNDTDESLGAERLRVDDAVSQLGDAQMSLRHGEETVLRRGVAMATVAHELRNALAVISLSADLLAEHRTDPAVVESATDIQRSAARMERLLLDLLDLGRIDAGTLRIEKRQVAVNALCQEVLAAYSPIFARRGITFTCVPLVADAIATFDHDRIVQVLLNILTNAMKFTPAGGSVCLSVERRSGDIEFSVADTGVGIAPDALSNVFQRFWRAGGEAGGGLGLGLHICENIVAAHQGRMWVTSDLGRGTTVRFTLPIHAHTG